MRTLRLISISSLFFILACSLFADPVSKFDHGLSLFKEGKNSEAISAWESMRSEGVFSGATYYNLGNAYYREGQFGRAILNYERAKKLLPRDPDITNNLDLVRLATVDKFDAQIRLAVWQWVDKIRDSVTLYELALLFEIFGLCTVLALAGWRFCPPTIRMYFKPVFIVLFCTFIVSGSWYAWRSKLDSRPFGVVLVVKTDVFSAPDEKSTQLFTLHEGAKVRMNDKLSGWVNIRLIDGRQGWIPQEDIDEI